MLFFHWQIGAEALKPETGAANQFSWLKRDHDSWLPFGALFVIDAELLKGCSVHAIGLIGLCASHTEVKSINLTSKDTVATG